jgi:choline dehydrogenase-like flavoprotein
VSGYNRPFFILNTDGQSSGENVQDHGQAIMTWERKDRGFTLDTFRNNATFAQQQLALYANNSSNPPSILDETFPAIAYVPLSTIVDPATAEELIAEAAAHVRASKAPFKRTLEQQLAFLQHHSETVSQIELIIADEFAATTVTPMPNKTYVTLSASPQHLLSRGSVHISSNNASIPPVINLNSFSVPYDIKLAVAGLAFLRKIAAAQEYAAIFGTEVAPGPGVDLRNYTVGAGFGVEYHTVGSASMIPQDQGGVVDSFLKVYGTLNVRVVDASIIPLHLSAHPSCTIYGIAEKAADMILSGK